MPGKDNTSTSTCNCYSENCTYVNSILGVRIEDDNNGLLRITMENDPKEYLLRTKKFKNCKTQKYSGQKLFGKYSNVYFDNNLELEEIARLIIAW
jgi:hypothetical protein